METMLSFDWKSVSVNSAEVIALMRKHRNEKLDVLFHYADGLYRVGVTRKTPENPFTWMMRPIRPCLRFAVLPASKAAFCCLTSRHRCISWQ